VKKIKMKLLSDLGYEEIAVKLDKCIEFYDPFKDNQYRNQKIKILIEDLDDKLTSIGEKRVTKIVFSISFEATHVNLAFEPSLFTISFFERFSEDFYEMYRCKALIEKRLMVELWLYYFFIELSVSLPEIADKVYFKYGT